MLNSLYRKYIPNAREQQIDTDVLGLRRAKRHNDRQCFSASSTILPFSHRLLLIDSARI